MDILLVVGFLVGIWVYRDARKRGCGSDKAFLWFLGVFLLVIVFLPVWLITRGETRRKPKRTPMSQREYGTCAVCGYPYTVRERFCLECGVELEESQ